MQDWKDDPDAIEPCWLILLVATFVVAGWVANLWFVGSSLWTWIAG